MHWLISLCYLPKLIYCVVSVHVCKNVVVFSNGIYHQHLFKNLVNASIKTFTWKLVPFFVRSKSGRTGCSDESVFIGDSAYSVDG